jgi:hypothetical protein
MFYSDFKTLLEKVQSTYFRSKQTFSGGEGLIVVTKLESNMGEPASQ